jgi:hypothetical protein
MIQHSNQNTEHAPSNHTGQQQTETYAQVWRPAANITGTLSAVMTDMCLSAWLTAAMHAVCTHIVDTPRNERMHSTKEHSMQHVSTCLAAGALLEQHHLCRGSH